MYENYKKSSQCRAEPVSVALWSVLLYVAAENVVIDRHPRFETKYSNPR